MKYLLSILFFFFLVGASVAQAPPPPDPPPPDVVPLEGIGILLAAGAALGFKKLRDRNKTD